MEFKQNRQVKRQKTIEGRIQHLMQTHSKLDKAIHAELRRPSPDDLVVQKLKRLKLKAKDELSLLEGLARTVGLTEVIPDRAA